MGASANRIRSAVRAVGTAESDSLFAPRRSASETARLVGNAMRRLPSTDNGPRAVEALLAVNDEFRGVEWPEPFRTTRHRTRLGDARNLSFLSAESVHLVVTSPPYWTLKEYNAGVGQLGAIEDYEAFLAELDRVWEECARVLAPGGRICCVVGDVCVARKRAGRHFVMPLHADIQSRARRFGLDNLTPIFWHKIANGVTEVQGNGAGFYGKPYQPGGVVKNDVEFILFLRKGGGYRSVPPLTKALSMLSRDEMQSWFRSIWTDVPGASTKTHPAPFPVELATRLVRMFSFAGDWVLDPFLGTGTTSLAAILTGRNSIGVELDRAYLDAANKRLTLEANRKRLVGATQILLECDAG